MIETLFYIDETKQNYRSLRKPDASETMFFLEICITLHRKLLISFIGFGSSTRALVAKDVVKRQNRLPSASNKARMLG